MIVNVDQGGVYYSGVLVQINKPIERKFFVAFFFHTYELVP